MKGENKTHAEEVRPFVLFMLTGGLVMGTVMISLQRYFLGAIVAVAGSAGSAVLALMARFLDRIQS
jgi:ABC-type nitrate/sulfonate/bicarbonate transport system permease component